MAPFESVYVPSLYTPVDSFPSSCIVPPDWFPFEEAFMYIPVTFSSGVPKTVS